MPSCIQPVSKIRPSTSWPEHGQLAGHERIAGREDLPGKRRGRMPIGRLGDVMVDVAHHGRHIGVAGGSLQRVARGGLAYVARKSSYCLLPARASWVSPSHCAAAMADFRPARHQ